MPGEPTRDVRIVYQRGIDAIVVGGRKIILRRFSVDGIVWGRETVWIDEGDRFAAIVSRIHILPLEGDSRRSEGRAAALQAVGDRGPHRRSGEQLKADSVLSPIRRVRAHRRATDRRHRPSANRRCGRGRSRWAHRRRRPAVIDRQFHAACGSSTSGARRSRLGLWDMHAHAAQIEWLPAYLAAGVTTIRDMGGETPFLDRDQRHTRDLLKPQFLLAGLVDGDATGGFGAIVAATPEQGRDARRSTTRGSASSR